MSKIIVVFVSIAIAATILGLAFAHATDTRPVHGTVGCDAVLKDFWKSPINKQYTIVYIPQAQQADELCK